MLSLFNFILSSFIISLSICSINCSRKSIVIVKHYDFYFGFDNALYYCHYFISILYYFVREIKKVVVNWCIHLCQVISLYTIILNKVVSFIIYWGRLIERTENLIVIEENGIVFGFLKVKVFVNVMIISWWVDIFS